MDAVSTAGLHEETRLILKQRKTGIILLNYCFSTDMQDEEIIFGGEKKLKQAIQEAYDIFGPKAIAVFSTCPVGLIGDDVHMVTKEMREKLGINIFGFSCEGLQRCKSVCRAPYCQQWNF